MRFPYILKDSCCQVIGKVDFCIECSESLLSVQSPSCPHWLSPRPPDHSRANSTDQSSGALTVTNAAASGKVIADLLDKYRKANGKIIHILHQTPEGAPVFTPGTDLAEEFKEVKAQVCWANTTF